MQLLLVVGTGIDDVAIKEKLAAAGIITETANIGWPRVATGIAFPEDKRSEAIEILGLKDNKFFESATDKENIKVLIYGCNVEACNWSGGDPAKFADVAREILLPVVMQTIVISVPHNRIQPVVNDGKVHIFIWSSPDGRSGITMPRKMWGLPIDNRGYAFAPSGTGETIFDDNGWAAAEIVGDMNIFIHHDVCHYGSENELKIFACICQEAAFALQRRVLLPREIKSPAQKILEDSKAAYEKICSRRFNPDPDDLQETIEKNELVILEAQQTIAKAVRENEGCKKKLKNPPEAPEEETKKFSAEFDKLCNVEGVESIRVLPGIVMVFTEPIIMEFHSVKYLIGRFRIDILLDDYNFGEIHCYNLDRAVGQWFHPNIKENKKPCFGNLSHRLGNLIGKFEIAVAIHLVIQYLKYSSPKGWEHDITNWPIVEGNVAANYANYARGAVRQLINSM